MRSGNETGPGTSLGQPNLLLTDADLNYKSMLASSVRLEQEKTKDPMCRERRDMVSGHQAGPDSSQALKANIRSVRRATGQ